VLNMDVSLKPARFSQYNSKRYIIKLLRVVMQYGYQEDEKQKQIEQALKNRMTFDQAIDYYQYVTSMIEKKWLSN